MTGFDAREWRVHPVHDTRVVAVNPGDGPGGSDLIAQCWTPEQAQQIAAQQELCRHLPWQTHEADEQVWAVHDDLRAEALILQRRGGEDHCTTAASLHALADRLTSARWRPTGEPMS